MFRALFCMTLLAAAASCEIEPGPRRAAAASSSASAAPAAAPSRNDSAARPSDKPDTGSAAPTPAPPTPPTPAAPPPPTPAAPPPAPPPQPAKESCTKAANHIADLQIASLSGDQKAQFEPVRPQFVQQVAQSCTVEGWSDPVVACITKAADVPSLQGCSDLLAKERQAKAGGAEPPQPPTPPQPERR
jgi:hypothetical protein